MKIYKFFHRFTTFLAMQLTYLYLEFMIFEKGGEQQSSIFVLLYCIMLDNKIEEPFFVSVSFDDHLHKNFQSYLCSYIKYSCWSILTDDYIHYIHEGVGPQGNHCSPQYNFHE